MGKPLKLKTGPNTFRVTFFEPTVPRITFSGLPDGVISIVTEESSTGFTVTFTPPNINVEVDDFELTASAEL